MFQGFSPETIDFLWGIRLNNNREWFLEHKEQYQKTLYEPLRELGYALYEPFQNVPGLNLRISRIYRDMRIHRDEPYKTDLWLAIRRESEFWSEHPTLFLDVGPYGVSYGFSLWRPRPAAMEAFRKDLEGNSAKFAELIAKAEAGAGAKFQAASYKREKPGCAPGMGPWYNWKSDIECCIEEPVGEGIFSRELKDRAMVTFQALLPAMEYFQKFTG